MTQHLVNETFFLPDKTAYVVPPAIAPTVIRAIIVPKRIFIRFEHNEERPATFLKKESFSTMKFIEEIST